MSLEHIIIIALNSLLFTICACVVGLLLRIVLSRPKAVKPPRMTDDCAEFYLDLHRKSPDVDFTRKEAEALYGVWQRWVGEAHPVRVSKEKEGRR